MPFEKTAKRYLTRKSVCAALACILCLGGCSSNPKRVDCENHLRAINAPAPKALTSASAQAQVPGVTP